MHLTCFFCSSHTSFIVSKKRGIPRVSVAVDRDRSHLFPSYGFFCSHCTSAMVLSSFVSSSSQFLMARNTLAIITAITKKYSPPILLIQCQMSSLTSNPFQLPNRDGSIITTAVPVSVKLQGAAANTAAWCTNVGNEKDELVVSVLIASESWESLQKLADGLIKRYSRTSVIRT